MKVIVDGNVVNVDASKILRKYLDKFDRSKIKSNDRLYSYHDYSNDSDFSVLVNFEQFFIEESRNFTNILK